MSASIYLADSLDYVVANTFEGAAETYNTVRSKQAETLTLTYESSVTILGLTDYTITVTVGTTALSDGCAAYPASFTVRENSEVPLTAVDGSTLSFSEWQDANGVTLSTSNPYTVTVGSTTEIVAIFV